MALPVRYLLEAVGREMSSANVRVWESIAADTWGVARGALSADGRAAAGAKIGQILEKSSAGLPDSGNVSTCVATLAKL